MKPKNTICLWFDKDAHEAARFYAATFPDSEVTAVHKAPGDYPGGKQGDVLTVEFTVLGIPCLGLNGGPKFKHSEAFSFQIATDNQEETDRYWNAIVGNGGKESQCGWCKDRWGLSWQITPRALTDALAAGGGEAKRAFAAMMPMKKIDIATIEAADPGIGPRRQIGGQSRHGAIVEAGLRANNRHATKSGSRADEQRRSVLPDPLHQVGWVLRGSRGDRLDAHREPSMNSHSVGLHWPRHVACRLLAGLHLASEVMDMHISRRPHRRWPGYRSASAFIVGLALVVAGASWSGRVDGAVPGQALNPCALLSDDEIKPVAAKTSVAAGVPNSLESFGYATCRYAWGDGIDRINLVVAVTDASRVFPSMTPDQIKQQLLASVRAGTDDAVISNVGDAAVFRPESFAYAIATGFVKGRILQVRLDGRGARDKKDQVIALLKSAALRL